MAQDRVAFEKRKQQPGETFYEYYAAIQRLAGESYLCGHCFEQSVRMRIMSGIGEQDVK